jgi:hypothetical protein
MLVPAFLVFVVGLSSPRLTYPVQPAETLPELLGTWRVLMIGRLDQSRPDSTRAESTIATELQGCLLRERLRVSTEPRGYEAMVLWGANGADGTIQRVFVHSQHGRFGIYQGRRAGSELRLRQENLSSQPDSVVVENNVSIRDRDHFSITSRLSNDRGRTWIVLSRWEYARAA